MPASPVCLELAANCDHCASAAVAAARTAASANKRFRIASDYAIFFTAAMAVFADAVSSIEERRHPVTVHLLSERSQSELAQPSHARSSRVTQTYRETPMKHRIIQAVAALFLVLVAAPLFAVQRNAVDEVIRMTRAGVAEDTILDYLEKTDARIIVTGDDVIAMTDAHVSKAVIKAVVDAADSRRNDRSYRDRSYVAPRVVVSTPYYYNPYPYYYYDPFWYRPSFSLNFGFGGFGYRGGHFGGGYRGGHGRGHR